jgi:hypothetical protein
MDSSTTQTLIIESEPEWTGDAGPMLTPAVIEYPNIDGPGPGGAGASRIILVHCPDPPE